MADPCEARIVHWPAEKPASPDSMLQKAAVVSVEAVASTSEGSQISCSEQLSQRPAAFEAFQGAVTGLREWD